MKENEKPLFKNQQLQIGAIESKQKILRRSPKRYREPHRVICKVKEVIDERPISYADDVNTLERKVGGKYQVDAPFSTQVPRFYENIKQNNPVEEYLSHNRPQTREGKAVSPKNKPKGLMESRNPRFDYY